MFSSLLRGSSFQAASARSGVSSRNGRPCEYQGLRILLVQPQAEHAGAQEIARLLARGLLEKGHRVEQIFFFRRSAGFQAEGPCVFCADERPENFAGVLTLLIRLWREMRTFKPDAVLCFQHYGNLVGAPIAQLAGAPVVIATQNTDSLSIPAAARFIDRLFGRVGVYHSIIAVSGAAKSWYQGHPQAYRRRLRLIEHGVAEKASRLTKPEARDLLGISREGVLLGCAARLHPMKNLDAAIHLLENEPHWRLALAGQGADLTRLKQYAVERGCSDRVHWLGELAPDEVAHFLRALDVFVFPSLSESFGLAAAEAAVTGVPVVANDLASLREVLTVDGAPCAVLTCATKPEQFHDAVAALLQDDARRADFAQRGRKLASRYSVEKMVSAYVELLEQFMPEKAT